MGRFLPGPTEKLARGGGITWAPTEDTIWSIDLSTPQFGFGSAAALTPYGLTYTRAASPLAAQWGTSSVFDLSSLSGTANTYIATRFDDAWRAGMALGAARTNLVTYSSDYTVGGGRWSQGGTVTATPGQAGPTGVGNVATLLQAAGVGDNRFFPVTGLGASVTVTSSSWVRPNAPPGDVAIVASSGTANALGSSVWRRLSASGVVSIANSLYVVFGSASGGIAAGARAWLVYLSQAELGSFPSDPIPTSGAIGTRAATFLNLTSAKVSEGLIAGRLQLELNLRAQGSLSEIGGTPHLLWADAGNRITINATTGVISIVIGGVTNTTTAITLARYDTLDIFVCFGGGIATTFVYRKNGGAWASLVVAGAALGSITPANMWLLSQSTAGSHFDGWLYKVAAYQPNRRPVWSLN